MSDVLAMFSERPYVVAFLVSFLVIAVAERGWLRAGCWLLSGAALGWLMEFSSTHNGFPFGDYSYHGEAFDGELSAGGVPIFASLSFAFLTYFGYSAGRALRARVAGSGSRVAAQDWQVLVLAAVITVWVDTVIDPVSLLGRFWFLGDLYHYEDDGFHFGVPLSNYAGWLFTSLLIVFVNQQVDAWAAARGLVARGYALPLLPLAGVGAVLGNFAFMIGVSVYLVGRGGVPDAGGVLASGIVLSAAFVVVAGAALLRQDRDPRTSNAAATSVLQGPDSSLRPE